MAKLIVVDGPDTGSEFDFEAFDANSSPLIVGRDPRVEVSLNDNAISREHCRLEISTRGIRIIDMGSRNRTYVNGDPVENSMLRDGDIVRIGDTDMRFDDEGSELLEGVASTIIKEVSIDAKRDGLFEGVRTVAESMPGHLDETLAKIQRILSVSRKIGETTSVPELFEKFFAVVVPALEASNGAFLVRDKKTWTVKYHFQDATRSDSNEPLRVSLSIVQRATSEQAAILSKSAAEDFREGDSILEEDIRSAMAVPLIHRKKILGVVYLDQRGVDRPFAPQELDLLQSAADPLTALLLKIEEQGKLLETNRNLLRTITDDRRILGESAPIREVLDFIQRAAPTNMTVLIQGQTGTGKELVSTALHYNSPRHARPFIAINCAALPENLIESELFGHERGAFTGAVARKKGRFELGDSGTVFLDEIADLSLPCQAKLLRLLEERCFERVGGTESIHVDVRIIAATNKDLVVAVEEGKFREDLLYRLSVLRIQLPQLRDRRDDILVLAKHFLEQAAVSPRPKKLTKAAEKKLMRYEWPGNVRQLKNVVESACVLGRGDEIQPQDLVLPDRPHGGSGGTWEPINLQELEKIHILKVLDHTQGNKKRAAEILGIERCTLYSKLRNYEI